MEMQPHPHTNQLDDRLMAVDCLEACKHLSLEYTVAALEAANPELRRTFAQAAQQNIQAAEEMFRFMQQRGWYSPTAADPQQVHQLRQQFHAPQAATAGAMPAEAERRRSVKGGQYGYGMHGESHQAQGSRRRQESPVSGRGQVPTEPGAQPGGGSPRARY